MSIIVARFSRLLNSPSRLTDATGAPRDNQWIGRHGEDIAASYLRAERHVILARNFRGRRKGEVDIVARDGNLLLFIEVKTRRAPTLIRPLDAVDKSKQTLIERGANEWLRKLRTRDIPWRFDVIEVLLEEGKPPVIRHIENAF